MSYGNAGATPCEAPRHAALFWPVGPVRGRGSQARGEAARRDEPAPWPETMHVWCTSREKAREGELKIDRDGGRIVLRDSEARSCDVQRRREFRCGDDECCQYKLRFLSPSRSRVRFIALHVDVPLRHDILLTSHIHNMCAWLCARARARACTYRRIGELSHLENALDYNVQ